jgi:hypothetical protein
MYIATKKRRPLQVCTLFSISSSPIRRGVLRVSSTLTGPYHAAFDFAFLFSQALCRSSGNEGMADFLDRDFSQHTQKMAAEKNAYTLLSQHRYELSAAMFILSGNLRDALLICLKQVR